MNVVNVALPVKLNSLFSYALPDDVTVEDAIGKRVTVNFNRRTLRGYVVSEGEYTDKYVIKPIEKILDQRKMLKEHMVDFAGWIAEYYFAGIGEVVSLMVPRGVRPAKHEQTPDDFIPKINELTDKQDRIYRDINEDINQGNKRFYLYGVTGSGKTEIYVKLIEDTLNAGRGVIFLVPEIALSYQTLNRLRERFGDLCAVLHSGLKGSTRLREYLRLYDGEAKIAIGPRSALFAPLDDVGLIIIDEENESSYKSEENPRFHARTCAMYLANKNDAVLVLGSATPSIESWYYARGGFFKLYMLKERYGGALLPDIEIVDNSKNFGMKNLSLPLINEVNTRLQDNEQIVLLQNRRGFANFIKCKFCDTIISCPKCNISLTYHKTKDKLICHHCGHNSLLPKVCPECGSEKIMKMGAGTQKIEDEIASTFSFAAVQRIDQDLLRSSRDLTEIFEKIESGEIQIIVGTQMIAKGLHFPNIKFVGIVNADMILNIPDFKAAEKTFALITQVAGRAGREGKKGSVMIQTFNPEHYAIESAKNADFEAFYEQEIEFRRLLGMPPFFRMIRLVIRGRFEEKVDKDIKKLSMLLQAHKREGVEILGPSPCLLSKINNNFRYQVLLKAKKISPLQTIVKQSIVKFNTGKMNYLEIDVDPVGLF